MPLTDTSDLWWKNAVVYCIDVEKYRDSNGDGIGDFGGLTEEVDYLAGLGVTCVWLMPFYPSPRRDNGYDIADYYGVDPRFGSIGQFVEFVRLARERGIRVIVDLVVNHTSMDHPWFQQARLDPDSPYRQFYVWADEPPSDVQHEPIFPGQQEGIWSYDREAKQFYLHRFYNHQPDLNIGNPAVRREIKRVIGFWLELGVSGFRIDAVPFLIEHLGLTTAEVDDPHDYLRDLRAFMQRRSGDAVLLAEANEPIDRLGHFFGDDLGDQMHVLFNFIGNQALYLSLVRGDARPLARALKQLPPHPPPAQWANFVRNHDELTLDKLTDAEREEVYAALAPEPEMRIFDRGIRRRLSTMLEGDQQRIRLCYSLLLSLPGTPVLLYGEEIGMGDDQSLPGRDAVRTPMQWSPRPGAGFSTLRPEALVHRPISEGPFRYQVLNVEAQRRDPGSLLNWMERMIRTHKEWPEIGWGDWEPLPTGRRAVLAHRCRWEGGQVLALHNFGRGRARVRLDVPAPASDGWRQLAGSQGVEDPGVGPIEVTLEPYGHHWFGSRERP